MSFYYFAIFLWILDAVANDESSVGTIHLPQGLEMKPCDNLIVRSIPGNFTTVLNVGRKYVELLTNETGQLEPFSGRWKWEPDRVYNN